MLAPTTFDPEKSAVIEPAKVIRPVAGFAPTMIAVFEQSVLEALVAQTNAAPISRLRAGWEIPIYQGEYNGKPLAFYHSFPGGGGAALLLEGVIAKGAKKVLFFGSCGVLDNAIPSGHFIVPTTAFRDEGTSHHYAPPADFVFVPTAGKLCNILASLKVPHTAAKCWTTDAVYRETPAKVAARKADGCAVVEMECASVMAVGQFRQIEIFQLLYAADNLDATQWDRRILGVATQDVRQAHARLLLETAARL